MTTATLLEGNCIDHLRAMADESVHAIVTDPPYGLANTDPAHVVEALTKWATGDREFIPAGKGFMGKAWDAFVPPPAVWDECMRVLKPGGHLLAFAGSRTFDLMTLSIRFAGFDIRDSIAWLYGSGFPKSMDLSKSIDKRPGVVKHPLFALELSAARRAAGLSRQDVSEKIVGTRSGACWNWEHHQFPEAKWWPRLCELLRMDAEKWDPVIAEADRKVVGKTRQGAQQQATSAYGSWGDGITPTEAKTDAAREWQGWGTALKPAFEPIVVARKPLPGTVAANVLVHGTGALNIDATRVQGGRWPANVMLDESQATELDHQAPSTGGSGKASGPTLTGASTSVARGAFAGVASTPYYGGELGGASRFFYVAKAPKSERPVSDGEAHPTVKPLALMRQLIKLVTPPGGIVVDPFAGSGTTIEAAHLEGFDSIGIEMTETYWPLIRHRIERAETAQSAATSTDDEALFTFDQIA